MELNKYQINRIKASVIEDIASYIIRNLDRFKESLAEEQNELQQMLAAGEEERSWAIDDKRECIKRDELYVGTWTALLDTLDKMLCK